MKFDKLTIKNFKCFDEVGACIETIKPINVIIGKNNSGKSSIIEIFKFLTTNDKDFFKNKRSGKFSELEFEHLVNEKLIRLTFPENTTGGEIPGINHLQYGATLINSKLKYNIDKNGQNKFIDIDKEVVNGARPKLVRYTSLIISPFKGKIFSHLSAERDIQPEPASSNFKLSNNGIGATNLLQLILNKENYDSDLVEKVLLDELNKIISPDIHFSRILVQQNENDHWEIYFESEEDGRVPLSKMGSGIKTVLLVLILLYIIPTIEGKKKGEYVFGLEELENNLHPSLQRRLYYYLYDFAISNNCIFFLTTHSNIVIDLYNSLENTQVLHINKLEKRTTIKSTSKVQDLKTILEDLDVRASDILQSNGIIWVEGPSDRIYLKAFLNLLRSDLVEGYHYSIMFYGGRLISNLSFDYDIIINDLIPLLKLNRNAFVIMDRDGTNINTKLNDTKIRIQKEIGPNNTWITKGREIENYLSDSSIEKWLKEVYSIDCVFKNKLNTKFEENIVKINKAQKIKYQLNKNKYANEIVQYLDFESIGKLDLYDNIKNLVGIIKSWNKM